MGEVRGPASVHPPLRSSSEYGHYESNYAGHERGGYPLSAHQRNVTHTGSVHPRSARLRGLYLVSVFSLCPIGSRVKKRTSGYVSRLRPDLKPPYATGSTLRLYVSHLLI